MAYRIHDFGATRRVSWCGVAQHPARITRKPAAAESRADFVHKLSIVLKELKETRGWLRFIPMAELLNANKTAGVPGECVELIRLVGKSVSTTRRRRKRTTPMSNDKRPMNNVK